eukprot:TRINITY_DN9013_c0_g2_i2.p1 TRINITY_DN9013_c0_g2~~TRINITY_DN9013_c0_g2_i2.p1  ORF type:complete len:405 (+),score=57.66 TRINITY_DN9013_c0_g2_i2:197-1411(+)
MGVSGSKAAIEGLHDDERYYGLQNFGNTCYANSVLQALYFCKPFRQKLLDFGEHNCPQDVSDSLLKILSDLFVEIHQQKKKTGVVSPKRFMNKVKRELVNFSGYMHQDAHEFFLELLNSIESTLEAVAKQQKNKKEGQQPLENGHLQNSKSEQNSSQNSTSDSQSGSISSQSSSQKAKTFVQQIFEGKQVNQVCCMNCERVTNLEEPFKDLSFNIDQNSSLSECLRSYCGKELLMGQEKFHCDECCCKQEATKGFKIKELPQVLVCHLKRFHHMQVLSRVQIKKLNYRIVFPIELKLGGTTTNAQHGDVLYKIFAVVVHIGAGMSHGHYVSLIKSGDQWLCFDDEQVMLIDEERIVDTFGATSENSPNVDQHGYILFYEREDLLDMTEQGVPSQNSNNIMQLQQ